MIPPLQVGSQLDLHLSEKYPEKIGRKMPIFLWKIAIFVVGGVLLMALSFAPADAQVIPPTPLPQVVATQQAAGQAAAQVGNLQAQRARVEAQLAEINANIENQIREAEAATAAAKVAAATQNAVEAGAAIGRLEGALEQLKASYAGKDAIIKTLNDRIDQLTTQSAEDKRTIDKLTLQAQQAISNMARLQSDYAALKAGKSDDDKNSTIRFIFEMFVVVMFLLVILALAGERFRRRRDNENSAPPEPPIDGQYTIDDTEDIDHERTEDDQDAM